MEYFDSLIDSCGFTHSIDMVYFEYFTCLKSKDIVEIIRKIHLDYPELSYLEHLDRVPHSKWDYYLDGVAIGGAYISAGKYRNYDAVNKIFDVFNMFEIRVNPNKHLNEDWFCELLAKLLDGSYSGYLRKYDYAIDIPLEMRFVQVLDTRKEPGLFKGTRYYGQAGRHGYLKIYDKQKDLKRQKIDIGILTRVEHTEFALKDKPPSLENIYILKNDSLNRDYSTLKDTDRAIVEMYLQLKALGYDYPLRLGRGKMKTLEPYLQGQYELLEYGHILEDLLDNIKRRFKATTYAEDIVFENNQLLADEDGFIKVDNLSDLPFD